MPAKTRTTTVANDSLVPRRRAFRDVLGVSISKGKKLEQDPTFPKPVFVGPTRSYFMSELQAWIHARPREAK